MALRVCGPSPRENGCGNKVLVTKHCTGNSFMAHVTQDGKKHCNESQSDICPYCQCSDSRFHRCWICEHFAWARDAVPSELLAQIPSLPEAVTCFGWDLMPSTMFGGSILCPLPVHGWKLCLPMLHLRFAAWAVVLASDEDDLTMAHIVESGQLPGLLQELNFLQFYVRLQLQPLPKRRLRSGQTAKQLLFACGKSCMDHKFGLVALTQTCG